MAMLVVLETLSPLERTVFVLHEAFGYEYADIAEILDRTPPTVRQLAHRAREHVQARRPRYETDLSKRRAATERFLRASAGGDLNELLELLAPDATLWADGGGKAKAPRRPIHGRDKIARFFVGISGAGFPGDDADHRGQRWSGCGAEHARPARSRRPWSTSTRTPG